MKPRFSIVLPCHNGEKSLLGALLSIQNQSNSDFECIIVDDASTDLSAKIATRFAQSDPRFRYLRSDINVKLPAALNLGFAEARGALLTWTSDDNELMPDFLASLGEPLEAGITDIVYSDYEAIDDLGVSRGIRSVGIPAELAAENSIGASFMFSRRTWELVGPYDETKFLFEDYDFWVRAYEADLMFYRVSGVYYRYRTHAGQLSNTRNLPRQYLTFRLDALSRLRASRADRARGYASLVGSATRYREWEKMCKCALLALALGPTELRRYLSGRFRARVSGVG